MTRRPLLIALLALATVLGPGALAAAAATVPTLEVIPGSPSEVSSLAEYDGDLYFSGFDAGAGQVLHRFDGTTVSVVPNSPATPRELAVVDGLLYFSSGEVLGGIVYSFDGTTFTAIPATTGLALAAITGLGGDVYFISISTQTLYRYDLPAGTVSPVAGLPDAYGLTVYDDRIFVDTDTTELWQVDAAGVASAVPGSPDTLGLVGNYAGQLYYRIAGGVTAFDGTTFAPVPGAPAEVIEGAEYAGLFTFLGREAAGDYVIYTYDGSAFELVPGGPTYAQGFVAAGGRLYFYQGHGLDGPVWAYDGSTFTDLGSPEFHAWLTPYDGTLYFAGSLDDTFDTMRLLRVVDVETPELAATGTEPSGAAVVGGITLLVGAVLLLLRRRAERSAP